MDSISITDSILRSIAKLNGVEATDKSFDTDIIIHINSAFMILNQLGAGPSEGFYIEDETETWLEYEPNVFISKAIQSFVYIKVRLVFDPPASPTVVDALERAAKEYEWRIVQWVEDHT